MTTESALRAPRIALQLPNLPGRDIAEQFANAARFGFDGVEINVGPAFDLGARLNEIKQASESSGLPVAAICTHPMHDPLHPDPDERAARLVGLTTLLAQAEELGAAGVVSVPVRPPLAFPGEGETGDALEIAIAVLGEWAAQLPDGSSRLFLEPLNRYEATFLRRVGQGTQIARAINHPRVTVLGDLFHMNIEEESFSAPLIEAGAWLGHVHVADNNRLLPGAGMLDFQTPFSALRQIGYQGWLAIECAPSGGTRFSSEPAIAFPETLRVLRGAW